MDFPFKTALHIATEKMLDESLAQVQIQNIWIFIGLREIRKLAVTEEIQIYCKGHFKDLGDDYMNLGEGIVFPVPIYGFKHISLITPQMPRVVESQEMQSLQHVIVHRIVPSAYLWWQHAGEAWTIPLEYQF